MNTKSIAAGLLAMDASAQSRIERDFPTWQAEEAGPAGCGGHQGL